VDQLLKDLSTANTLWRSLAKKKWHIKGSKRWAINWRHYYKQQSVIWSPGKFVQLKGVIDSYP